MSSVQPVPAERKSIQEVAMVCGVRRVIVLPRRHARRKKKKRKRRRRKNVGPSDILCMEQQ